MSERFWKMSLVCSLMSLSLGLMACSASVSSDGPAPLENGSFDPNNGFADSKVSISGPAVEGHWTSLCHSHDGESRWFDVTFTGSKIVRIENVFSDDNCKVTKFQKKSQGRFRFIDQYRDGSYNIEYAFTEGNGVTSFPQEKILLKGKQMYLSDFQIGEMGQILSEEPLSLEEPVSVLPAPVEPNPYDVKGEIATDMAEAKFAFCNIQGTAVLIDFQGQNLTRIPGGKMIQGSRACNSSHAFSEGQPVGFTITWFDRKFDLRMGKGSYIRESGYGLQRADALIGGSSGICAFLKNKGTQGVFDWGGSVWDCR